MSTHADQKQFQQEVQDFLNDKLTADLRHWGDAWAPWSPPHAVVEEWTHILDVQGWSVPEWPVEHGGTGWTVDQVVTFKRELTLARAPRLPIQGVDYVGPVVIEFGSPDQKQQILPRIRSGKDWWAQGYSEPNAGSDLSSLKCRAVRNGDHYLVNGTKIWTTNAHESNKIFCLVRTSDEGKPQAGITFLMFDLDLPGIEIRPLPMFNGEHEFNQVFFNDVRVPASGLLGTENGGWTVAKHLLVGERAHSYSAVIHVLLQRTREFASTTQTPGGSRLMDDPAFRMKLDRLDIELANLDASEEIIFELLKKDLTAASALSSVTKIQGTELHQRITELALETLDIYGIPQQPLLHDPTSLSSLIGPPTAQTSVAAAQYFFGRAITLAGGATEVQKNVIAARVLGL